MSHLKPVNGDSDRTRFEHLDPESIEPYIKWWKITIFVPKGRNFSMGKIVDSLNNRTGLANWLVFTQSGSHETKLLGLSFSILNLMFALRFIVIGVGLRAEHSIFFLLLFLGCAILAVGLSVLSLIRQIMTLVKDFLSDNRAVFQIAIYFLVLREVVDYVLSSRFSKEIRLEIGGWFMALFLWLFLSWGIFRIRNAIADLSISSWKKTTFNWNSSKLYYVSLSLPLILLVSYWVLYHWVYSLPAYANYDPEFAYMLNSFTPLKDLILYRRMDHLGVVMQILGSTFYVILYPLSLFDTTPIFESTIRHPGIFLLLARTFLLVINCFVIIVIIRRLSQSKKWDSILLALCVALLYFTVHPSSFDYVVMWSPNSFNFIVGTLLLFGMFDLFKTKKELTRQQIAAIGFLTGVGVTFHVYMITLIVGIGTAVFVYQLLTVRNWWKSFRAGFELGLYSVFGYVTASLIILPHYKTFFSWIKSIFTHQGNWGNGEPGFTSVENLSAHFVGLLEDHPTLFLSTGFIIVVLLVFFAILRRKIFSYRAEVATFIGLIIQLGVLSLLIFKHPLSRYLLSVAAILPILFMIAVLLLKEVFEHNEGIYKFILAGVTAVILVGFFGNWVHHIQRIQEKAIYFQRYEAITDEFLKNTAAELGKSRESLMVLWTHGSYSKCNALWHASAYSGGVFSKDIERDCHNDYHVFIWNGIVALDNDTFRGWDVIVGNPSQLDEYGFDDAGTVISTELETLAFIVSEDH
jgi:hypothetical protein